MCKKVSALYRALISPADSYCRMDWACALCVKPYRIDQQS